MKKRALCWLLVLVMVFSLLPLSALAEDAKGVYAVFGEGDAATPARTVYKFVAHDKAYTFNNDQGKSTDQQILKNGDALYDVGEPMPNAHETFDGWYIGDQKVEFGTAMTVTKNETVEVTAKFVKLFTVTFYADAEKTTVLTVKEVAENDSLDIDGLKAPAPASTQNFAYWTDGAKQYAADGKIENITANIALQPVFATGAWLSFSGEGGSYTAPKFFTGASVAAGETLTPPTREGYTFAGWKDGSTQVTDASGRVTSAITIPADGKTLTASWNPNNNVKYTVAYWQQNANDDGYSLAEKPESRTGTAGTDATYPSKSYQGFTLNQEKTNAAKTTIKGDGTTIRNVYFDRNQYTLTFKHTEGSWISGYHDVIDKEFTAKYGQYIGNQFPITNDGARWKADKIFSQVLVYLDIMPAANITFTKDDESFSTKYMEFYVEALPGQTGTTSYGGKSFVQHGNTIPAKYNFFTKDEDFVDLTGFAQWKSDPAFDRNDEAHVSSGGTLKLYYTRNSYDLAFEANGGPAVAAEKVPYEQSLAKFNPASYEIGKTTKSVDGKTFIFQGWYDNEALVGEPFDFGSTMPAHAVLLYAKWAPEQYRIDIDPNGGVLTETESTFTWKEAGETISTYNDVSRDYVADPNGTYYYEYHYYGRKSVEDSEASHWTTRVARYVTAETDYTDATPKYVYEEGAYALIGWYIENADGSREVCPEIAEVTGPMKLVAEWRRTGVFHVVYDAGEHGTAAPADNANYADQAETVTAVAPTAKDGWVFTGWLLNGETYVPGDPFIVDAELADSTKTITLTAQYRPADEAGTVPTAAIKWHANNGTDAAETDKVALNEAVAIRPADTFTYAGHTFLGWAKTPNAGMNDLFLKADGTAFQAQKDGAWEAVKQVATNSISENNDLYAIWMENATYVVDFNAKMKLADEAAIADPTSKNGDFSLDGTTAVYQLKQLSKDQKLANGAALTFDGVDTAVITGKFYADGAAAADPALKHVTVIPADNVYFDDDLVEKTVAVGDGSGYNAEVQASNPDQAAKGQYTFSFNGTGVDVYCTTNKTSGTIVAKLLDKDGKVVDQSRKNMYNHSETERYNIPTISYRDLAYGQYTVVLTVLENVEYRLDGVRIYNPTNNGTQFVNMRDVLINDKKDPVEITDQNAKAGALFVDDDSTMGETRTFEAYKAVSPKNEIYLKPGESLMFQLKDGVDVDNALWIGLSAPDANAGSGTVTIGKEVAVTSGVDMYYPITADMIGDKGVVTIENTGKTMISVTDLKVVGLSAGGADSLIDQIFAPITEQTLKIAANGGVDPDQVKDAWNANAWNPKQVLNALFQLLMQSLSGLFNGLGNW